MTQVLESTNWADKQMLKRLLIFATLSILVTLNAIASDREDGVSRTQKATSVFKEIMNGPDQGIPQNLLESAKCIAIIPGDIKFAFIFGGSYGRGLVTWSHRAWLECSYVSGY